MIDFRLRRTRWLTGGIALVVVVALVTLFQSRSCSIVVYNESETPREGVTVMAPGFVWRVPPLAGTESRSRRVDTDPASGRFVVHLGRANEPEHEIWFEPGPGRRLVIRIWRDGLIESDVQTPWWE